jgi:hypothetical protein
MKTILQIAIATAFIVSSVLISSAQIRPTPSTTRVIKLPSGNIWIIRTPPPVSKPAPALGTLPPWATKLTPAARLPLLLPATKPISVFNFPAAKPKIEPLKDWNKFIENQRKIDLARTVTNGLINMITEHKKKDMNKLPILDRSSSISAPSLNVPTFDNVPQYKPSSKNYSPVVVITSNLDKPAAAKVRPSPAPQLTNSGLTTNSSLKVVYVTPDGTAILIDGQNNYYSLPLTIVRNKQENVFQNSKLTKPKRGTRLNR